MEIDSLKEVWKNSSRTTDVQPNLGLMTEAKNNPRLKRVKKRLLIESFATIAFTALYYTALDGNEKPLWVNLLLVISAVMYSVNRLWAYKRIHNQQLDDNTSQVYKRLVEQLKKLKVTSSLTSLFFGSSVILFLTANINFTTQKYYILIGLIVTFLILTFQSYRLWDRQVKLVQKGLKELIEQT